MAAGLKADVLGGGRISHQPNRRSCDIYGYSAAFGPAAHEVSASLFRRAFPLYDPAMVTVSYEGY
jgi:phosphohistidine phosphatase